MLLIIAVREEESWVCHPWDCTAFCAPSAVGIGGCQESVIGFLGLVQAACGRGRSGHAAMCGADKVGGIHTQRGTQSGSDHRVLNTGNQPGTKESARLPL
jgi:hypothetical protein